MTSNFILHDNDAVVSVQLTMAKIELFTPWFRENGIKSCFAYGKYYFDRVEDVIAFKLKFGDILHGA